MELRSSRKRPSSPTRENGSARKKSRPSLHEEPVKIAKKERLLDRFDVVAWDFDCTITKKHTCTGKHLQPADIDQFNLHDFIADLDLFKRTIQYLEHKGKTIAILSYGTKATILRTMERIFGGENPFNDRNVITPMDVTVRHKLSPEWPNCYEAPAGLSKNFMLQLLQERIKEDTGRAIPNDRIVLIDDSSRNIENASKAGYFGIIIPAERCAGFNRNLLEGFLTLFREDHGDLDFDEVWDMFSQRYRR